MVSQDFKRFITRISYHLNIILRSSNLHNLQKTPRDQEKVQGETVSQFPSLLLLIMAMASTEVKSPSNEETF